MATVTLRHGTVLETATPAEIDALLRARQDQDRPARIRATEILTIDANGFTEKEIYTVPLGFEFEARRAFFDLDSAADPNTGAISLNAAGRTLEVLRSGQRIEYLFPTGVSAVPQVPGMQTWGYQSGPYFRNGEAFGIRARGFVAATHLGVYIEGILTRPGPRK